MADSASARAEAIVVAWEANFLGGSYKYKNKLETQNQIKLKEIPQVPFARGPWAGVPGHKLHQSVHKAGVIPGRRRWSTNGTRAFEGEFFGIKSIPADEIRV